MRIAWIAFVTAACLGGGALAQDHSAHSAGLRVAQNRGYANAECYARVFAKHAVVVEKSNGRRGWYAASTPAYNAEQRSRCGIDRLQDMAARREATRFAAPGAPRPRGGVHGLGLKVAAERGYTGAQANCFARVYATYASPQPAERGRVQYAISGASMHVYSQDMFQRCGISR